MAEKKSHDKHACGTAEEEIKMQWKEARTKEGSEECSGFFYLLLYYSVVE